MTGQKEIIVCLSNEKQHDFSQRVIFLLQFVHFSPFTRRTISSSPETFFSEISTGFQSTSTSALFSPRANCPPTPPDLTRTRASHQFPVPTSLIRSVCLSDRCACMHLFLSCKSSCLSGPILSSHSIQEIPLEEFSRLRRYNALPVNDLPWEPF